MGEITLNDRGGGRLTLSGAAVPAGLAHPALDGLNDEVEIKMLNPATGEIVTIIDGALL